MGDGRVRQQPLEVCLWISSQVAKRGREGGEERQTQDQVAGERPGGHRCVRLRRQRDRLPRDQHKHEPAEEGQRGAFGSHREKRRHLRGRALEHVGAPELERHGGQLEAKADQQQQKPEYQHQVDSRGCRCLWKRRSQIGQIRSAELAGDQADPVKHNAAGAAAVNHILQRGFAALPATLEKAGQRVARQAGHLHGDVDHQEVIGGRHERHADRGAQEQRIKVRGVLVVRNAGQQRQPDDQGGEGE